jgi:tRNA-binding protein
MLRKVYILARLLEAAAFGYRLRMQAEIKPIVSIDVFNSLDIRLGRVLTVESADAAVKPSYKITADFGKYGVRTSVGRFTQHSTEELIGKQIFGVLNFEPRELGGVSSEFLTLGLQYPKGESGEATVITPMIEARLGSKLF